MTDQFYDILGKFIVNYLIKHIEERIEKLLSNLPDKQKEAVNNILKSGVPVVLKGDDIYAILDNGILNVLSPECAVKYVRDMQNQKMWMDIGNGTSAFLGVLAGVASGGLGAIPFAATSVP